MKIYTVEEAKKTILKRKAFRGSQAGGRVQQIVADLNGVQPFDLSGLV